MGGLVTGWAGCSGRHLVPWVGGSGWVDLVRSGALGQQLAQLAAVDSERNLLPRPTPTAQCHAEASSLGDGSGGHDGPSSRRHGGSVVGGGTGRADPVRSKFKSESSLSPNFGERDDLNRSRCDRRRRRRQRRAPATAGPERRSRQPQRQEPGSRRGDGQCTTTTDDEL